MTHCCNRKRYKQLTRNKPETKRGCQGQNAYCDDLHPIYHRRHSQWRKEMSTLSRVPLGPRARLRARSHPVRPFSRLRFETLEERRLLSVTPQLLQSGTGVPSNPAALGQVGDVFFFSANDGTHGSELWKTDGTTDGTVLVKDIRPGTDGGVFGSPGNSANLNGALLFVANDGTNGYELWRSDGTSDGTTLVKDIRPGNGNSRPKLLVNVGGTLFFAANDGTNGYELWRSDGTSDGTTLVKDIRSGALDSSIGGLIDVNGTLFFSANDGSSGSELWKSDGTEAGTVLVSDITPGLGGFGPLNLTNVSGTLYFTTDDAVHGSELWKSDGTAENTVLVRDIRVGATGAAPGWLANVGGTLFFAANDGTSAAGLWKSDGSTAGTVLVKSVTQGSAFLTSVNDRLFFTANDGTHGFELWTSDGTSDGTVMLTDNPLGGVNIPLKLVNANGTLLFSAGDSAHGIEFWKSDGTSAGTVLLKDINPGPGTNQQALVLGSLNGTVLLNANDGTHGFELWKSDGTTEGTVLVKDINRQSLLAPAAYGPARFPGPPYFTEVNGTAFFPAYDPAHGTEMWRSDGTAAGTVMVKDVRPGGFDGIRNNVHSMAELNGSIFFIADDGPNWYGVWKSDGTDAGTVLIHDLDPRPGIPGLNDLRNVAGTLYFRAFDYTNGDALWKSDGTVAGTSPVDWPGIVSTSSPTEVGGTLFFLGSDGSHGAELWKSDGTAAGTTLVKDIRVGSEGSSPFGLTNVGGTLFFSANDGTNGYELWKSDGTTAGTVLVKDIRAGLNNADLNFLTNVSGTLFFQATDGIHGWELWKSDGNTAGTVLVKDIEPGPAPSSPTSLVNVNGTVFFYADDGLWKSDGTTAGTVLIKNDLASSFTNMNGTVFFAAHDGNHGFGLWRTDGTSEGTVLVGAFNPGAQGSSLARLTNIHGTLFFGVSPPSDGRFGSLWILRSVNVAAAVSQPEGNSDTTPVVFPVTLSMKSDQPVEVPYQTSDGTATEADGDYVGASGTLTFAPGQTVGYVTVLVNGDTDFEPNEQFYLNLIDTNDGFVATPQAVATIVNDEHGIADRHLFYKGSTRWNVTNGATFSDDNAIAADKSAYLPGGGTSTFANVSSYWRGINGIMVDVAGAHGPITANDFIFKVGNNNSPNTWTPAPAPTLVTTRAGAGTGGSDRVELIWADNAIQSTWLEIIVRGNDALGGSNGNTGLLASDVFFFGSALGDAGAGNAGAYSVTSADETSARNDPHGVGNSASITNVNDFNRDGLVNSTDQIFARNHLTNLGNQLQFLTVGAGGPFAPEAPSAAPSAFSQPANEVGIATALTLEAGASSSRIGARALMADLAPPQPALVDASFERWGTGRDRPGPGALRPASRSDQTSHDTDSLEEDDVLTDCLLARRL
jgi:trimeric autotransporter adhesin